MLLIETLGIYQMDHIDCQLVAQTLVDGFDSEYPRFL